MNYKWRTFSQSFIVDEAILFKEFSKDQHIRKHADEYLIIFNICNPEYRSFDKSRIAPTRIFMLKEYLDNSYARYLMHELDFNDEIVANEFRRYFNRMLKANNV